MEDEKFQKLVKEAIMDIPEKFQKMLDNVEIVTDDFPSEYQLKKLGFKSGDCMLGLYEGVPKTKRGHHYANVLPDKITIFKIPIERLSKDENDLKNIIKKTVWHEIAHHFGIGEKRVQDLERKKFSRHV